MPFYRKKAAAATSPAPQASTSSNAVYHRRKRYYPRKRYYNRVAQAPAPVAQPPQSTDLPEVKDPKVLQIYKECLTKTSSIMTRSQRAQLLSLVAQLHGQVESSTPTSSPSAGSLPSSSIPAVTTAPPTTSSVTPSNIDSLLPLIRQLLISTSGASSSPTKSVTEPTL